MTQRFLHILCASHLGEPNHPKVEHAQRTSCKSKLAYTCQYATG